jgi:hypothetical protein
VQRAALEGQAKERAAAATTKSRLAAAEKRLKALEWEHEVAVLIIFPFFHACRMLLPLVFVIISFYLEYAQVLVQRLALVDAENGVFRAAAAATADDARQMAGARALLQGAAMHLLAVA